MLIVPLAPSLPPHRQAPSLPLPVVREEEEQVLVSLALYVELDRGGEVTQDARHGLAVGYRELHIEEGYCAWGRTREVKG